jgi:hypothetical protein
VLAVDDGAVVEVEVDAPGVVVVVELEVNVAWKGTFNGVGSTTGTPFTVMLVPDAPISRLMPPVPGMIWLEPAGMVPSNKVVPESVDWAWTQHGPVEVVTVNW